MPTSHLSHLAAVLALVPGLPFASMSADDAPGDRAEGTYVSPSWGWKLKFDPAQWTVTSESSDDDVDTVILASREAYTASARVLLHTGPRGPDTLRAHLEEAIAAVSNEHPEATVTLAKDKKDQAILVRLADYHWIASYIVSDLPDGSEDRIVELDCLAVRGYEAVLTIRMTCLARQYDGVFPLVETLRGALSRDGEPLGAYGVIEAGGGRPVVQY